MSFMLMQTPDPLTIKDALPDFSKTTHIFLPINDCRNVEVAEGGSHWSLLLVSVIDSVAFHYDSLDPMNEQEAALATQKISQLLGKPLRFHNLDDSPQQENSSDCGVYVCIQMRHLLVKRLLQVHAKDRVTMSMGGKYVDARGGRKEMLQIIEGFRKEGERRRSWVSREVMRYRDLCLQLTDEVQAPSAKAKIIPKVLPGLIEQDQSSFWFACCCGALYGVGWLKGSSHSHSDGIVHYIARAFCSLTAILRF